MEGLLTTGPNPSIFLYFFYITNIKWYSQLVAGLLTLSSLIVQIINYNTVNRAAHAKYIEKASCSTT